MNVARCSWDGQKGEDEGGGSSDKGGRRGRRIKRVWGSWNNAIIAVSKETWSEICN